MTQKHIILLGLTTSAGSDWRAKIAESAELQLSALALFATGIGLEERQELYALLEASSLQALPHVHLRHDTEAWEVDYFVERWRTEVFNLHAMPEALSLLGRCPQHRSSIYLENGSSLTPLFLECLASCAGLCLDFSHWADHGEKRGNEGYELLPALAKQHPVGCCHLSAIVPEGWWEPVRNDHWRHSRHWFEDLREFDYLRAYRRYFPHYLSLELENSLVEQLEAKAYAEELLVEG
jgi:hypothetical protein